MVQNYFTEVNMADIEDSAVARRCYSNVFTEEPDLAAAFRSAYEYFAGQVEPRGAEPMSIISNVCTMCAHSTVDGLAEMAQEHRLCTLCRGWLTQALAPFRGKGKEQFLCRLRRDGLHVLVYDQFTQMAQCACRAVAHVEMRHGCMMGLKSLHIPGKDLALTETMRKSEEASKPKVQTNVDIEWATFKMPESSAQALKEHNERLDNALRGALLPKELCIPSPVPSAEDATSMKFNVESLREYIAEAIFFTDPRVIAFSHSLGREWQVDLFQEKMWRRDHDGWRTEAEKRAKTIADHIFFGAARPKAACQWHDCQQVAQETRVDIGGSRFALCRDHERQGESAGYWRPK